MMVQSGCCPNCQMMHLCLCFISSMRWAYSKPSTQEVFCHAFHHCSDCIVSLCFPFCLIEVFGRESYNIHNNQCDVSLKNLIHSLTSSYWSHWTKHYCTIDFKRTKQVVHSLFFCLLQMKRSTVVHYCYRPPSVTKRHRIPGCPYYALSLSMSYSLAQRGQVHSNVLRSPQGFGAFLCFLMHVTQ